MIKRGILRFILIFLSLCFCLGNEGQILAANLDGVYIRPDRNKANLSPNRVLVVIRTASSATENGIKVTVGSAWSLSTDNNDFEVSLANLPNGIIAYPGIGTATAVNGQQITFPGTDLTAGTDYGFYIIGGIGVNPLVGDGQNYLWQLATLVDGNEDRSQSIEVPIVANDQISVTGTILANASDYQATISSDLVSRANQNQTINYKLTYGSYSLVSTKPLVITANWSRGTLNGFPTPSLDIVDYVVGSSTIGYGGAEPVVDLLNRKIVWTIANFPANTLSQTVSFSLKTNQSYTGTLDVNFDVGLDMTAGSMAVASKEINQNYRYLSIAPTSTPIPTSTPSPGPTSTPVPSTTPTPTLTKKIFIEKVELVDISQSNLALRVTTNQISAELTALYGTSTSNLNNKIITLEKSSEHLLKIDGLKADTFYYFRLIAQDENTNTSPSDLFIFKTAAQSIGPRLIASTVLITSQDKIIYRAAPNLSQSGQALIVISKGQKYALEFKISGQEKIKEVKALLRPSQILGINSVYGLEPPEYTVDLVQIRDGEYMAYLNSPPQTGFYDLLVRMIDFKGNVVEEKIGTLEIINPLTVYDQKTGNPIEAVKIFLSIFNQQTVRFEPLTPSSLAMPNPLFSEPNGEVPLVLPPGRYRAEITALEYQAATIEFTIGAGGDQNYPEVFLVAKPPSLLTKLKFYAETVEDVFVFEKGNFTELFASTRFFRLVSKINLLLSAILIFFWQRAKKRSPTKKETLSTKKWLVMEFLELSLGAGAILILIFDLFFLRHQGFLTAGPWFILGMINLICCLIYIHAKDKKILNGS